MTIFRVQPAQKLNGTIEVAGDKSISHRSIIFGSLAKGTTTVDRLLEGEDVLCTVGIFKALGVKIQKKDGRWVIQGKGIEGLKSPKKVLYCGNSGTTLRLLTGLFSGFPMTVQFTGDDSLNRRPMGRVMEPLAEMGAQIREIKTAGKRFIEVHGRKLKGGDFKIRVASAQLKSAILLAGLSSGETVSVIEPEKSRDHSERMLKAFGAKLQVSGLKVTLKPSLKLKSQKIVVPGDISSAAFFIVAALISRDPRTEVTIRHVGLNPTRTGILDVLKKMGAKITVKNKRIVCGEPVGDLVVRSSSLKGTTIRGSLIPRLIDEIPILSVAAAVAKGKTIIRDAEELRVKETDRIRAIAAELPKFGVKVKELKDGLEITGGNSLHAAHGKSYGDHRMAMSMAVLASITPGMTQIDDTECVKTSFPNFTELYRQVGGKI